MDTITIAGVVVELTLVGESEIYGEVYEGRRHDALIEVLIDDMPRCTVSSRDLGAIGYMMVQHNGFNLCEDSEDMYEFTFKL
jgi:hypothetical protein